MIIRPHAIALALLLAALRAAVPTARAQHVPAATTRPDINLRHTVTVDVVRKTQDAVVNISATRTITRRMSPFGADPFWQHFDVGDVVRVPSDSLGSGFLVHEDGYVVTNHHVVDRARQIHVELVDGRKLPAELVSSDADADLAILKVADADPLPRLELADSGDLMIGEPVIAVGNPFGFSHSVSTGIVSAVHRDLTGPRGDVLLGDLVQTDAAINPGNSGGPLLNAYGQVVGINTAIRGDAQNIGFAIPVNRLRDLVPDLLNPAQVTKVDVPLRLSERRTVTAPATVRADVCWTDDAGAEHVVTAINDHPVRDVVDACVRVLQVKPDEPVKLTLAGGAVRTLKATAVPLPDAVAQAKQRLGVTVEPLTPMRAERYGLEAEEGLLVTEVTRDSVAARAGLQPGDVIVQLGRYRVSTLDDLGALLRALPERGRVRVGVVRGDRVGYGTLEW
jgi:serine protease Do